MIDSIPVIPILLLCVAIAVVHSIIAPFVYETTNSTLRRLPGPFAARFSRLCYLRAVSSGQFHYFNIELHKKYGKHPCPTCPSSLTCDLTLSKARL